MPVLQSRFVEQTVLSSPEGRALPRSELQRESIFGEAQDITSGKIEAGFNPEMTTLAPQIKGATSRFATIGGAMALLVALGAAAFALSRIRFEFRARAGSRGVMLMLMAASTVAILTTLGIVLSWSIRPSSSSGLAGRRKWRCVPTMPGHRASSARSRCTGNCLHRRDHRDDRRPPGGADERNFTHLICPAEAAPVAQADSRDTQCNPFREDIPGGTTWPYSWSEESVRTRMGAVQSEINRL